MKRVGCLCYCTGAVALRIRRLTSAAIRLVAIVSNPYLGSLEKRPARNKLVSFNNHCTRRCGFVEYREAVPQSANCLRGVSRAEMSKPGLETPGCMYCLPKLFACSEARRQAALVKYQEDYRKRCISHGNAPRAFHAGAVTCGRASCRSSLLRCTLLTVCFSAAACRNCSTPGTPPTPRYVHDSMAARCPAHWRHSQHSHSITCRQALLGQPGWTAQLLGSRVQAAALLLGHACIVPRHLSRCPCSLLRPSSRPQYSSVCAHAVLRSKRCSTAAVPHSARGTSTSTLQHTKKRPPSSTPTSSVASSRCRPATRRPPQPTSWTPSPRRPPTGAASPRAACCSLTSRPPHLTTAALTARAQCRQLPTQPLHAHGAPQAAKGAACRGALRGELLAT
jgi:hypothetical protein